MKVSIISPYSLSAPGGVQGQVLGLARALRTLGVDARVIGPCDGPPPEPGRDLGRARACGSSATARSRRWPRPRSSPRSGRSRRCATSSPTSCTCTSRSCRGRRAPRCSARTAAKVGTFHAAGEDGHPAYRALKKVAVSAARQLTIRTAVSADARRMAEEALGGSYIVLPNGVDLELFAKADPVRDPPSRRPVPRPPRAAQGARRAARRVGRPRSRTRCSGSRATARRRRRCATGARRTSSGSVASPTPRRRRG